MARFNHRVKSFQHSRWEFWEKSFSKTSHWLSSSAIPPYTQIRQGFSVFLLRRYRRIVILGGINSAVIPYSCAFTCKEVILSFLHCSFIWSCSFLLRMQKEWIKSSNLNHYYMDFDHSACLAVICIYSHDLLNFYEKPCTFSDMLILPIIIKNLSPGK